MVDGVPRSVGGPRRDLGDGVTIPLLVWVPDSPRDARRGRSQDLHGRRLLGKRTRQPAPRLGGGAEAGRAPTPTSRSPGREAEHNQRRPSPRQPLLASTSISCRDAVAGACPARTASSCATRRKWGACPRYAPGRRSQCERDAVDSDPPRGRSACARSSHGAADRRAGIRMSSASDSAHGASPTTENSPGRSLRQLTSGAKRVPCASVR
jgi:hypothetical protein